MPTQADLARFYGNVKAQQAAKTNSPANLNRFYATVRAQQKPVAAPARPKAPGFTPQAQQPTAAEFTQWNQGAANAKQNYLQTLAKNNMSMQQASLSNANLTRENAYNQQNQRRDLPDSYIGRGMYHSGAYGQGLSDLLVGQYNQNASQAMQYGNQMAGYRQANQFAGDAFRQTQRNLKAQEMARRIDLASQIKGIV